MTILLLPRLVSSRAGQLSDPETTLMPAQIDVWLHHRVHRVSQSCPLSRPLLYL